MNPEFGKVAREVFMIPPDYYGNPYEDFKGFRELIVALESAFRKGEIAQAEKDASIATGLSVLADHEKKCCGDIPEIMLRNEIAQAIMDNVRK